MEVPESKPRKEDESELLKPPALWYRPPVIVPNYGAKRKRNVLPKSKIQHVLLHDNKNQKNMLESQVKYLSHDFKRSARLADLHKRSFLVRQSMKQVGLWQRGIDHVAILPEVVVQLHCPGNSKETAMQSAAARKQSVTKAELRAMFPNYDEESVVLELPDSLRKAREKNNRGFNSRQTSVLSMTNMSRYRNQGEAIESSPLRTALTREKTAATTAASKGTQQLAGAHGFSPTQPFNYNRSKTAMPKMQSTGLTRKFSTYNSAPRRQLVTAAGNNYNANERAADDPRFTGLKKQLIAPEKPIDGFIQLSPCGQKIIQKYGVSHYDPVELTSLLDKYNDVSFMSTRKLRSAQRKEERRRGEHLLPTREAFVSDEEDRNSFYSSVDRSSSDSLLLELE